MIRRIPWRSLLSAVFASFVAACSVPTGDLQRTTPAFTANTCCSANRAKTSGVLYVGRTVNYSLKGYGIFVLDRPSLKLLRIDKGLTGAFAGTSSLAVDRSGYLYAATFNASVVAVYAPGKSTPAYQITRGVDYPRAIALDAARNLYVANCYNCTFTNHKKASNGSITVYAPGQTSPSYTITEGIDNPNAIALDASGDLYVSNCSPKLDPKICTANYYNVPGGGTVSVYRRGSGQPAYTISNGIDAPQSLAIDRKGNLYAANVGDAEIAVYPPQGTTPSYDILLGIFDGVYPVSMTFDSQDDLFVAMCSFGETGRVCAFPPGSGSTIAYLQTPPNYNPRVLQFDAAGNLYVLEVGIDGIQSAPNHANQIAVAVYPPFSGSPSKIVNLGTTYATAMALGPP